ncbi:hypothetical protein [Sphingobacterium psychroaquaticum]|uniref:Uncharacterized protein n=1 Tax=Sphingobacterium psychroaquaticum TaxID=561061 RepID=A0A1X7KU63_9SPHI|nr:hypothetical protein [Sphingobacterium psychroaquaticum]QBQ40673.1 hypothetical protein E2P86_05710 [Sphingobacterium psychroaquaticum]SMG45013.1 hypothetical protein SAMN05660862_3234 [Sphingobacterium psychroaquaticum]
MAEEKVSKRKRYDDAVKTQVIKDIVEDGCLIGEVLFKYRISNKRTVVNWLKSHLENQQILSA